MGDSRGSPHRIIVKLLGRRSHLLSMVRLYRILGFQNSHLRPRHATAGTDDMRSSQYTLSLMQSSLPIYESLFDIPFPLPKMDWLAAKAYGGAMEHWGFIIGGDSVTLWVPEQGLPQKMITLEVVTHELAHQW